MKKFLILFLFALSAVVYTSCEEEVEAPGTNYVTFETSNYSFEVTPDGSTTKDIYVYTANTTNADRTFAVTVDSNIDASYYSIPTSVTIPAGTNVGTLTVTGNDLGLDFSSPKSVELSLTPEDGLSVGENMTINFLKECIYNKIFIGIEFDKYPEEVYWSLTNSAGDTVAASATPPAYGAYDGLTGSITNTLCLESDTYTFTIYDAYQDGAGAVSITTEDGKVLFSTDGDYGAGVAGNFTL